MFVGLKVMGVVMVGKYNKEMLSLLHPVSPFFED